MKSQYVSISLAILGSAFSIYGWSQDQFTKDFDPIRQELTSWDPVRGEWLASSMVAISKDEPIPDRYFPEEFTPAEMLKVVPEATRMRIGTTAKERTRANTDAVAAEQWREINSLLSRSECSPTMGRSYGDPHLSTFDGVNNSFQTVGEFVLVKSASDNMEVHVRQKAISDEVSVSTAIAMDVAGDNVAIYGKDYPDGNTTTPLRINGEAVYLENDTYYLPYGGTIRQEGGTFRNNYLITWPTGETVSVNGTSQMNIAVQVYPCSDRYEGILGNANNDRSDDFNPRGMMGGGGFGDVASRDFGDAGVSDEMQRQYLAFLARDFASSWRITQDESLFAYGFNQSTYTFTDPSYPRVHRTINDMSQQQRDRARRDCERAGITGNDLNGCIYDVGFARIPPSPRPTVPDRTTGRDIKPVTDRQPNVNPGNPRKPIKVEDKQGQTINQPGNGAQPIERKDPQDSKESGKEISKPLERETPPVTDKKPEPVKPTPTPVEDKKPAPKPYEPPVEEEKPRKVFGGFTKPVENNGSGSSSGSGSSGSGSTPKPVEERKPQPVSRPEPVIRTPEPVRTAPTPVRTTPTPTPAPSPAPTPTPARPTIKTTPGRIGG